MSKSSSSPAADVPQVVKTLARQFYVDNARMNAAKKDADAGRKVLFAALEEAGIEEFDFATTNEAGDKLRLFVEVKTPSVESIDVATLRTLVDDETFMRIVTASKKAVEDEVGKAIAVKSTVSAAGTRNVSVKPVK